MQVKKFEAKTMQEALQMIKTSMGPEAIILATKNIAPSFGLAGEKSVQVTAAISETVLRKKILAERKLNEKNRAHYNNISAKKQKEFINKAFNKKKEEMTVAKAITSTRYIDILDEGEVSQAGIPPVMTEAVNSSQQAEERIRSAAQEALEAAYSVEEKKPIVVEEPVVTSQPQEQESHEVMRLRSEISQLKEVIADFHKVPQSFITMHPGASEGIPYELSEMFEKLTKSGISVENTVEILNKAKGALNPQQLKKPSLISAWVARYLLENVSIAENRFSKKYHVFVGSSAQGKTASLVKMASHLVICEKKKVAIITTDTKKIGASEQLRIYAQILNVPFAVVRKPGDWERVRQSLGSIDHILVDFPGLSLKNMSELDFVRSLMPPTIDGGRSVHYVQSAMAKDADALESAHRYKPVGFDDIIFTSLDESAQHGLIYNLHKKMGVPLHSFGLGPQIPEDFEPATKERVVDLIFKLTKLRTERSR